MIMRIHNYICMTYWPYIRALNQEFGGCVEFTQI